MTGTTLILWGGNQKLAQEVSMVLRRKGLDAEIGGGNQQDLYIGTQVINQINRADNVILLVQWPPEGMECAVDVPIQFRPNLMYEWGYVNAKFPAEDVHVFVVGVSQNDLPTDLKGIWVEEIAFKGIPEMASEISEIYLKKESSVNVDLDEIFISWHKTKEYLLSVNRGEVNYNQIRLANTLLHSIQPAYYNNEIDFLRDIVFSRLPNASNDLLATKEIVIAVTEFYEVTNNQLTKTSFHDLKNIKDSLSLPMTANDPHLDKWLNIFRLDFLGLCNMFIADLKEDEKEKQYYSKLAVENFQSSFDLLAHFDAQNRKSGYISLWKGYILRNQGKLLCDLHMPEEGDIKLRQSLEGRQVSLRAFKSNKTPDLLLTHLELEMYLVEIDLAKYGLNRDEFQISETIESLKKFNKPFDLWKLVISEAKTLAYSSKNERIKSEINKLYEHL